MIIDIDNQYSLSIPGVPAVLILAGDTSYRTTDRKKEIRLQSTAESNRSKTRGCFVEWAVFYPLGL
jgi:hypothetical protein